MAGYLDHAAGSVLKPPYPYLGLSGKVAASPASYGRLTRSSRHSGCGRMAMHLAGTLLRRGMDVFEKNAGSTARISAVDSPRPH